MALTRQTGAAVVLGLAGLVSTAVNPNFELSDLASPPTVIVNKRDSDIDYGGSGLVYGISYSVFVASLFSIGYNVLTGRAIKKKE